MKNYFTVIVTTLFLVIFCAQSTQAASFTDVKSQSESGKAIEQLSSRQIINGFPDGTFRPNSTITRQQAAKMVANILQLKPHQVFELSYTDVSPTMANYNAIIAVSELGIMTGYDDETFRPDKKLTRSQAAKIISEAFRLRANIGKHPYKDIKSEETSFYVANLYENNVTKSPGKKFNPNQQITRAQFALFVTRAEQQQTAFTMYATDLQYSAFSYSEFDQDVVDVEADMYRITLHALKEGTARVAIYSMNVYEEFQRQFYLVHVTKENGKFVISLEEQSIYDYISFATSVYHYNDGLYLQFVPTSYEIYDELGQPVAEDQYEIIVNGENVEVTMFKDGEFQLYFANDTNRSTHAILSYIENFVMDFSIETISPYIELSYEDVGFTVKSVSIADYINYENPDIAPFTVSLENGIVLIKPIHLGEGVVRFIDDNGTKHYIDVLIHQKAGILIVDAEWE